MLEKTLENPLDCKEIQPVHPKGTQSWIFIGRTDAEEEALILWPPDRRNWLIRKDPDAGKDWRQEKKGMTRVQWRLKAGEEGDDEGAMVGWCPWLNGHEFEKLQEMVKDREAWCVTSWYGVWKRLATSFCFPLYILTLHQTWKNNRDYPEIWTCPMAPCSGIIWYGEEINFELYEARSSSVGKFSNCQTFTSVSKEFVFSQHLVKRKYFSWEENTQ